MTPDELRRALERVPPADRDDWVNRVLGIESVPEDGPDLPRGCVPYLPCSVETLLRAVDAARVGPSDVFVDVGSGVGRAALFVHLLTGAAAIGVEIQSALVHASRDFAARRGLPRVATVHGDAAAVTGYLFIGTVFFLYCPFSGWRLEKVLDDLEPIARTRPIRVCTVDLPLPPRPWLALVSTAGPLAVHRSTCLDRTRDAAGA